MRRGVVIELVRSKLPRREQLRWHAALSEPPLVARRERAGDVSLVTLALLALVTYFAVAHADVARGLPTLVHAALRLTLGALVVASARATLRSRRAARSSWPSGRFLFEWGYAEVEDDTLRIVPIEDLWYEIRGRTLGVGPIRLRLRSGEWWATFFLRWEETEAVATALASTPIGRGPTHAQGYRETPARIDGPRVAPSISMRWRDLGWTAAGAYVALMLPLPWIGLAREPEPVIVRKPIDVSALTPPYRSALLPPDEALASPGYVLDMSGCTASAPVISEVTSFLHARIAAPPGAMDDSVSPPTSRETDVDRLWARCSWHVDPTDGTLVRTEAHWGLDRGGATIVERHAVVTVGETIHLIDDCDLGSRGASFTPPGLVIASLHLVRATIRRDLYGDMALLADGESRVTYLDPDARSCVVEHTPGPVQIEYVR